MRSSRTVNRRRGRVDGANWLSFSDLMSSILLIFILIMFYIMYQYFDMYEISMAEIARQQYDLDQANASLEDQQEKLTEAESQMLAQQIRLNAAQQELEDAQAILESQKEELSAAEALLDEKEAEIADQQASLDALGTQLDEKESQINRQQAQLTNQEAQLNEQAETLSNQEAQLNQQAETLSNQEAQLNQQAQTLSNQQAQLDQQAQTLSDQEAQLNEQAQTLNQQQEVLASQQQQIEQLVGMRPRIIQSLRDALRAARISAQVDPSNGSIALESDVLFAFGKFELTEAGKDFVDRFLPVYLDVLFSEEYRGYVAEIIIEGHTDSTGAYITNLQLSQQRALAVASYVLSDDYQGITARQKELLREIVTANGRSYSDPVLDAFGQEDLDASRRVVFKFRLTDEQMIQQMKNILEAEG